MPSVASWLGSPPEVAPMRSMSFRPRSGEGRGMQSSGLRPIARVALVALACGHWGCEETPEPVAPPSAATEEQPPPNPPPPPQQPPPDAPPPSSSLPSSPPPQAGVPPQSPPPSSGGVPAQPAPLSSAEETAPPPAQWLYSYPNGQWVYTASYGWVWVPAEATTSVIDGVPYAYLYTPGYGWTWYISPWGPGVYHYGVWVRHPWFPIGWRGPWVAHPHIVIRLGGHGHRR